MLPNNHTSEPNYNLIENRAFSGRVLISQQWFTMGSLSALAPSTWRAIEKRPSRTGGRGDAGSTKMRNRVV